MQPVTGIFAYREDAERALDHVRSLGIHHERINYITPAKSAEEAGEKAERVPTSESEQPGMGMALGGVVGGALGVAGGSHLGMAVAGALLPGVGPVLAAGAAVAALFGIGGAITGAKLGEKLEESTAPELPRDEMFVYEDALRRGRSVLFVFAEDDDEADRIRAFFAEANAESVDAARERWWLGLRSAERERYADGAETFERDEAIFRRGFEAALQPENRSRNFDKLDRAVISDFTDTREQEAFRRGYERGREYLKGLLEEEKSFGARAGGRKS